MESKWKNQNFLIKLKNSFSGIKIAFKTELNLKIQLVFAIIVIVAGFIFKISLLEFAILTITIFIVLITECINTAIENAVDMLTEEYNEKAKITKDIAAGSVMLSAISSIIIGCIIFIPKLLEMF